MTTITQNGVTFALVRPGRYVSADGRIVVRRYDPLYATKHSLWFRATVDGKVIDRKFRDKYDAMRFAVKEAQRAS